VFAIHLHLVWVTQYRQPVLVDPLGLRWCDLIREVCGSEDVPILKEHVSQDHVPLRVSIRPQVTIRRLARRLKGKTAYQRLQEFAPLKKRFWGRHLWARGYFCCRSGNVTDEAVAESIAHQGKPGPEDFRVEHGELEPAWGRKPFSRTVFGAGLESVTPKPPPLGGGSIHSPSRRFGVARHKCRG
jgi:putative transposase